MREVSVVSGEFVRVSVRRAGSGRVPRQVIRPLALVVALLALPGCETLDKSALDGATATMLDGAVGMYSGFADAQIEAAKRETAIQAAMSHAASRTRLEFSVQNTADGHRGIFGTIQNIGADVIDTIALNIHYIGSKGRVLYTASVRLDDQDLRAGAMASWNVYLLDVPGTQGIRVHVMEAE